MSPLDRLTDRLLDARRLLEIHEATTGAGAGRRRNVDVLNRSALILTIAAWEGFCEELVSVSAAKISRHLQSTDKFPKSVIVPFMAWFYDENDLSKLTHSTKMATWSLVGSGWRLNYRNYAERKVNDLNTPSFQNVRKLFSQTLGISELGKNLKNGRISSEHYLEKLDEALTIRHQLAHGTRGKLNVGKKTAKYAIVVVEVLAKWMSASVRENELKLDLSEIEIS